MAGESYGGGLMIGRVRQSFGYSKYLIGVDNLKAEFCVCAVSMMAEVEGGDENNVRGEAAEQLTNLLT